MKTPMSTKIALLAAATLATLSLGVAAPAFAASHARDTFIPSRDDLAAAQAEGEGLVTVARAVELRPFAIGL